MKSGFVTIAGRPNAGKSTILNTLIGEKVSIVSWKPQTTRDKITGILNVDGAQVVFIDTPGIHKAKNRMGAYMQKSVDAALKDVDVILYLISLEKPTHAIDLEYLRRVAALKPRTSLIVVLNKCDAVAPEEIPRRIQELQPLEGLDAIIPVSARTGKNKELLLDEILKNLPEGTPYYPDEMYTDKSVKFMCAELIREKTLRLLEDEIPYGIGVQINQFQEEDGLVRIDADIICEKKAHKPIIIGKNGAMLKKISTAARINMEKLLDSKVFLSVWVRIKEDWRDSDFVLNELGYNKKDL